MYLWHYFSQFTEGNFKKYTEFLKILTRLGFYEQIRSLLFIQSQLCCYFNDDDDLVYAIFKTFASKVSKMSALVSARTQTSPPLVMKRHRPAPQSCKVTFSERKPV